MTIETLYASLYLEINLFCIILVGIIAIKSLGVTQMVAERNFVFAICSVIVFFASDTIWVLIERGFLPYSVSGVIITKDIYFFSTSLMCFAWFVYFEYLQDSPFVKHRKDMICSSFCVFLQLILIIVNKFTNILYYVDENNHYTRGPLFITLYVFSYLYVIFTCSRATISLIRGNYTSDKRKLIRLATFPILPAIGGIIQFYCPALPVACVMLSLSTLLLYLGWLMQLISIDPLTHLNNRKQMLYNYDTMIRTVDDSLPIYLLMIDANKFKSINDTYGHIEGDAALVRIADALKKGCAGFKRRLSISRYGGDEFVVLAKAESDEIIQELIQNINRELEKLNKAANAKYDLTISIGYAKTETGKNMPFKKLEAAADKMLYDEKKKS